MSILLLLIPLSVLFVVVAGVAFFWAANRRQFSNVDSAAFLPMLDGDPDAAPAPAPAQSEARGGTRGSDPGQPRPSASADASVSVPSSDGSGEAPRDLASDSERGASVPSR